MQLLSLLVSLTLSLLPLTEAEGVFINPSGQNGKMTTYRAGEKVDVEWSGTAGYPILSLGYYSSSNVTVTWLISNAQNYPTGYTWTPRPAMDGFSNWEQDQFYLYIVNGTNFGAPFQSPAFLIRKPATTTSAPTTTRSTVPQTEVPTPTPTPSPTAPAESDPVNSDAEGLSTGAKAGIGAGVGGCALLAIGLLAFFFVRRRKRAPAGEVYEKPPYQETGDAAELADQRGHEKVLVMPTTKPAEAPSTTQDGGRPTAELHTQPGERYELA
ncbi:hypothetical protein PG996_014558 [Apiospora saccharicola]|uniref:Mid2 domain-containing protein n=1 Tax=Apiospora saccharicola TaxID=335842 RepID=A0ABR1TIN6_9PEZI